MNGQEENGQNSRVSIQLSVPKTVTPSSSIRNEFSEEGKSDKKELNKRKIDEVIPCKGNHLNLKQAKLGHNEYHHDKNEDFIPKRSVEGFGAALLRGMGWKDGQPYGRSQQVVEPVEPKSRPYLAGLGSSLQQQIELDPRNRKLKDQLEKQKQGENKKTTTSIQTKQTQAEKAKSSSESSSSSSAPVPKKKKAFTWLQPNLYVRYINEGKHYLQKGLVMDIQTSYECTIKMDSGEILENVGESSLETIIPKQKGVQCMVVKGDQKGFVGHLVSKDREKETCLLKNEDDDVVVVSFDNCCEFRDF